MVLTTVRRFKVSFSNARDNPLTSPFRVGRRFRPSSAQTTPALLALIQAEGRVTLIWPVPGRFASKHVIIMHARTYDDVYCCIPAVAIISMSQYWHELVDSLAPGGRGV